MFFGFFILLNKNLQKHPYQLFAWEIMTMATYYSDMGQILPYWGLRQYSLFQETIFWKQLPAQELYYYSQIFYQRELVLKNFLSVIVVSYLSIELCIYADFYLLLKNPFYPKERRMLFYFIFIIVVTIFGVVVSVFTQNDDL